MLCSIVANDNLHVFQVTATGDLVHRSHAAGTGNFPSDTITSDCDPKVAPTAEIFNNNLHVFAQKTNGQIVWAYSPTAGRSKSKSSTADCPRTSCRPDDTRTLSPLNGPLRSSFSASAPCLKSSPGEAPNEHRFFSTLFT